MANAVISDCKQRDAKSIEVESTAAAGSPVAAVFFLWGATWKALYRSTPGSKGILQLAASHGGVAPRNSSASPVDPACGPALDLTS
jgi:hypothetical protein